MRELDTFFNYVQGMMTLFLALTLLFSLLVLMCDLKEDFKNWLERRRKQNAKQPNVNR